MSKIESFNKTVLDGVDLHISMFKEQNLNYRIEDFKMHVNNLIKIMEARGIDPIVIGSVHKKVMKETGVELKAPCAPPERAHYSLR
jgi:hypothetical protein